MGRQHIFNFNILNIFNLSDSFFLLSPCIFPNSRLGAQLNYFDDESVLYLDTTLLAQILRNQVHNAKFAVPSGAFSIAFISATGKSFISILICPINLSV